MQTIQKLFELLYNGFRLLLSQRQYLIQTHLFTYDRVTGGDLTASNMMGRLVLMQDSKQRKEMNYDDLGRLKQESNRRLKAFQDANKKVQVRKAKLSEVRKAIKRDKFTSTNEGKLIKFRGE